MEIELPDGTVLEAPDDADPSVVAKNYLAKSGQLQAPAQEPTQEPQERSFMGDLGRAAKMQGLEFLKGATQLVMLPADAVNELVNLARGNVDLTNPRTYITPGANNPSKLITDPLTAAQPQPETGIERFATRAAGALGGAAGGIGLGGAIPGVVGQALTAAPGMQAAGAITGAASGQAAAEMGAPVPVQMLASVAGGMAPGVVKSLAAEGTKRLIRGGASPEQVQQNIDDFKAVGAQPSVGQATENRAMRATESTLARTPGAAGVMAKRASDQADDIGQHLERTAGSLAPKATAEQAGRAIQRGISGEGGFTEQFRSTQGQLYDKLDDFIPKDQRVNVSRTRDALSKINQEIDGAPELSRFFKNSKIGEIRAALEADVTGARDPLTLAPGDRLPYEALKKVRTLVGQELENASLVDSVPRSKWKALYGALSSDLEAAAKEAGPKATAAYTRANNYTRAGMRRLEVVQNVIERNGGPEAVFKAATSGTKEGATTLRAVMQSLPTEGQKTVAATVLRRLGRAKPGVQDDLGEAFSTETFLTNWNSMAPEAKVVLFNRFGPEFRKNMDTVARTASNLRAGSAVFRNPSGTAGAAATYTTAGAAVMAVLTGNPGTAAAIGAGVGGANLTARLMTHPPFVAWLAKATRAPVEAYPALVTQLTRSSDPLMQEAGAALQQANEEKDPGADQ